LYFAGAQTTTLTTAIGNLSTGEKQIAGVYIKTDATLETKLSTAIDVLDPFSVDHLAEIQAAASAGSVPVVGVELVVGLTDITDAYFHWDLRILFGALDDGSGGTNLPTSPAVITGDETIAAGRRGLWDGPLEVTGSLTVNGTLRIL
jgi:hypothetical protein